MTSELADQLNTALSARYHIERELGSGGMATVFMATDLRHQRPVAIKVLHPDLSASLGADRFLREIQLVGRLLHPHIVTLFDSGDAGGLPYYVMALVEGESLRDRLRRETQLPLDDTLRIARDVADALEYAHGRGVIHRDIKPENILLHGGHAFVTDFGIARAVSEAAADRITQTGLAVGTPAYMSPEQAAAESELDARSDVYSLACVIYEMLAGAPPYSGPTAQATLARRLVDPVPRLRTVRSAVPLHVEQALNRALARVPADRFPSAVTFARALTTAEESVSRSDQPSIAVLPFDNFSTDPENEYFADGITEDVIAQLAKIRALKVISRTSVMPFRKRHQNLKEIAAQLGVTTLLEGSVRRSGDRVRIVAQLIDANTDQHLWAETYDRQLTDVFAIQGEVAMQIASALRAELTPSEKARIRKEPTSSVTAYQLYLFGRQQHVRYTEDGMRQGIAHFERAIEHDAEYALAHASIALGMIELGEAGMMPPAVAYARAAEAAERAVMLDPNLAEAHTARGHLKFVSEFDWTGAEASFRKALELSPNSADACDLYGRMLSAVGRHDEAIRTFRRAAELDPLAHRSDLTNALLRAGRYDEALEAARQMTALDPQYDRGQATLAWAHIKRGQHAEGIAALERATKLSPGNTVWMSQLGQAHAVAGNVEKATEILRSLEARSRERYVSPYHFAYLYTGLGDRERAIDFLERAFDERAGAVYGIKESFLFETLRGHPRFTALLRRLNLA